MSVYLGALDEIECIGEDLVLVVGGLGVSSELHGILDLFVEHFDGFVGIIFLSEIGIVPYNFGWEDSAIGVEEVLHDVARGERGISCEAVAERGDVFRLDGSSELLF
jgi:uncharacterized protein (DUF2164 family)